MHLAGKLEMGIAPSKSPAGTDPQVSVSYWQKPLFCARFLHAKSNMLYRKQFLAC